MGFIPTATEGDGHSGVFTVKRTAIVLSVLTLLALGLLLPACNTTKGLGTDIEKAGDGLQHSAERNGAQ